jgi:hypothetical protein
MDELSQWLPEAFLAELRRRLPLERRWGRQLLYPVDVARSEAAIGGRHMHDRRRLSVMPQVAKRRYGFDANFYLRDRGGSEWARIEWVRQREDGRTIRTWLYREDYIGSCGPSAPKSTGPRAC